MDRVIFGDNQFFGINHMSAKTAAGQVRRFDTPTKIFDLLCYVNSIGIKSFMFTTHQQLEPVFKLMKSDAAFDDFKLLPCIPYAHKYANAISDLGIFGAISKFSPGPRLVVAIKTALAMLTANPVPAMKLLVDSEMKLLRGHHVEAIFLQNLATDLLLGLGMESMLAEFSRHVEKKHGVKAGFVTMNHVRLYDVLTEKLGVSEPLICSCINRIGFRMNPGKAAVEDCIRRGRGTTIAMSVLASGALAPDDAIEYVSSLRKVSSVLFGASTEKHILQTKQLVDQYVQS